jgi:diguanylate cyclase (GGDEF)-like protein
MAQSIVPFPLGGASRFPDGVKTPGDKESKEPRRALEIRCARLESKLLQLKRLSCIDDLTGLANRRYLDRMLKNEIQRACRTRLPLTLIICDVDHFKWFNDSFGHPHGDTALRLIGNVLRSYVHRAGDVAARYGGEEFALLLPSTGPMNALHFAERLRLSINKLKLLSGSREHPGTISISLGVTTYHSISPCEPIDIIGAADAALYDAKGSGRNCIRYRAI